MILKEEKYMDEFSRLSINIHDLVNCFANALDARELHTAHHSKRVADNVVIIENYLNLPQYEREMIHLAAHLHDIGKIGIPDRVLLKEGRLNEEEWNLMKKHPFIGSEMISNIPNMKEISDIILHHHERYDGKGYPYGLKGGKIPLGSRIIAICDSIDAMLSNRSYRKKLTIEECKNEIIKNIDIMYDSDLVKIAIEHWDDLMKQYQ